MILGASFVFVTVIVKDCASCAPFVSVAVRTISWSPTLLLVGVPERKPVEALKLSHDGLVVAAKVILSPASTSDAANV